MTRKIAAVTGNRADFSHLRYLLHAIHQAASCQLQLVVTGAHLSSLQGMTVGEIEAENLPIAARVSIDMTNDSDAGIGQAVAQAMQGFVDAFRRLRPDLLVILGDRYEVLAAATAALVMRIPIAHIHGGEITEGALDESIRHAISKMANLHFPAAAPYRDRLLQMGESPARVFNFGAPIAEVIRGMDRMTQSELEADLGFALGRPLVMMTFHPVTLGETSSVAELTALHDALDALPSACIIVTGSNVDHGAVSLRQVADAWAAARKGRVHAVASLGVRRYISLLALADVVVGNSSSGLIDAPLIGVPVVDIGDRQKGRLAASSVQQVPAETQAIHQAIERALQPAARESARRTVSPYDAGSFSGKALDVLQSVELGPALLRKSFCDQPLRVMT